MIEINKLKKDFNSAASSYDEVAIMQKEVADRLFDRISFLKTLPLRVLDIGSGTGFLTKKVVEFFPNSEIIALDIAENMHKVAKKKISLNQANSIKYTLADMHQTPFKNKDFDLIVSNLTFQWSSDLDGLFKEISRILSDDGLIFFSMIGERSLDELKLAYQNISPNQKFQEFYNIDTITQSLKKSGINQMIIECEQMTVAYKDVNFLIQDLKKIGANNKINLSHKGLIGKQKWKKFKNACAKGDNTSSQFLANYNIIYTHAFKTMISGQSQRVMIKKEN